MANDEQVEILRQGEDVWNKWRKDNPKVKPDISFANLRGADLSETNLSGTNFRGADLSVAYFINTNLIRANLRDANISGADLSGADLRSANLSGADISGIKFYRTARDEWKIDGIKCDYVYFDPKGEERTPKDHDFRPGEFEELYKQLPTIEYYFENGFTPIDAIVIDKVVQAINEKHPEFKLKLDSLHSRGQPHAVFTILHKEYADEAIRQIKLDYETKIKVIEAERNLLERLYKEAIDRPQTFINTLQIENFIEDKSRNIHAGGNVIGSTLVSGDDNKINEI